MFASWFIFAFKGFLFTFDDLNGSLINIKEAIEDLPDRDSPHVKKLRRMYERTCEEMCMTFLSILTLDNIFVNVVCYMWCDHSGERSETD